MRRGGAGFQSAGPALSAARGRYFFGYPRPTPVQGTPLLIPWTGPRLSPPNFNRDPSGARAGTGPGNAKNYALPRNELYLGSKLSLSEKREKKETYPQQSL